MLEKIKRKKKPYKTKPISEKIKRTMRNVWDDCWEDNYGDCFECKYSECQFWSNWNIID